MHLILGAGCAGLSLACALLDAAVDEPILLVDRRTTFEHDRTWCFWSTSANLPFAWLASHGWPAWCLVGRDGRTEVHRSTRHPYLHLPADRFYAVALERLDRAANVELRLGERVLEVHALAEGVRVRTSRGVIEGAVAYDAMGGGGPLNRHRPAGAVELRQCFLGQEVEVERPVFDASTATLMDFRAFGAAAHGDVLRFMYVLPLGPTRALVEDTSLGRGTISPEARRSAIAAYLDTAWAAGAVQIHREERGALPMTTHRFPVSRGSRVLAVGAAAGALRPSSGYAFVRLQRHVQAVARAVVDGAAPPAWLGARRHHGLDALFLRALAADPPGFDQHLLALAGGVDARTFARFMTDASSVREDAAVVAAMARPGFMRAMVKGALGSRQPRRVNLKARATGRAPCDRHPERTRLAYSAPGWVALAVVGALAVVAPDAADTARWLPFLLGLVWFSLPHGAVDHHVPRRLGRTGGPAFVAGYLAAVVAGLAAWALAPVATLAAFLLAAAVHWGSGDAWYARAVHRRAPFRGRLDAALFVAARGALPVALPALAHPAELARAADAILRTVGAGPAPASPGRCAPPASSSSRCSSPQPLWPRSAPVVSGPGRRCSTSASSRCWRRSSRSPPPSSPSARTCSSGTPRATSRVSSRPNPPRPPCHPAARSSPGRAKRPRSPSSPLPA